MAKKNAFVEYVVGDLLSGLKGVEARAMFGEYGLYLGGAMFAIVSDDVLYFKAGDANREDYRSRGSRQYSYVSGGKDVSMPYWEVPVDVLDDREEIARWAGASSRVKTGPKFSAKKGKTR